MRTEPTLPEMTFAPYAHKGVQKPQSGIFHCQNIIEILVWFVDRFNNRTYTYEDDEKQMWSYPRSQYGKKCTRQMDTRNAGNY
ncbi:hypothetical protein PR048_015311 [Dryococelus australis]|uniref:Uncharacterized protein n=1 Tax=Dryococelus australis TaxID=614101 RepID=A0ABQ9HGK3_9NEOP|nr:hypothetical protein PR048_015311 [Dryococelus australis]